MVGVSIRSDMVGVSIRIHLRTSYEFEDDKLGRRGRVAARASYYTSWRIE